MLGDEAKPKSWSKYAKDSEAFKKKQDKPVEDEEIIEKIAPVVEVKKSKKTAKIEAIIGDHKNDPLFQEFMQSHAKDKLAWENDVGVGEDKTEQVVKEESEAEEEEKIANKEISDADYMNQLMGKAIPLKVEVKSKFEKKGKKSKEEMARLYTIKIRNLPKKIKREELIKFFRPSKAHSVRIPHTPGIAYVGFKLERDLQRALTKDKSFLKGKQIHVYDFTEKNFSADPEGKANDRQNPRWQDQQDQLKNEEAICDSGKLFFRNLAYTVTEDDVQKIFENYGTVVEVNIPVDSVTRKIKGFGTVTFMMPEHAVVAYTELNGTLFHGRMFHVLPGKSNDTKSDTEDDPSSFKKKKQQDLKKSAGSAHNWNTLFLGSNAVAEVMSRTYGRSKEEILDSSTGGTNAAVRLALGETQIVLEMKKFLESEGVRLEAFDESTTKRSKTVIIAKNLPAGTDVEELREKFSQFGLLEKIILPPSGITCLVKFEDPSEARKAFKKLAYSKFKHLPLYLEWAPENTFKDEDKVKEEQDEVPEKVEISTIDVSKEKPEEKKEEPKTVETKAEQAKNKVVVEEDDDPPEPNTTLFMKNLHFDTVESKIEKAFKHLGLIHLIQLPTKRNPDNPKQPLRLGYGFIQFKQTAAAEKALKTMQFSEIDNKQIELQRSDRTLQTTAETERKQQKKKEMTGSTKIMVKNIPFQANLSEIRDLFKVFGEMKAIRLPKKMGSQQHRGFGFVDYVNKSDAKNAYEALHHSTHLYGRRLVLEWAEVDQDVDEIRKRTADQMGGIIEESKPKRNKKALLKDEHFIKFNSDDEEDESRAIE